MCVHIYIHTYIDTCVYPFLLDHSISVTMWCPKGGGNRWTWLRWGWHRMGPELQCPGAEDVLGLPQVPSWTNLPWVAAEGYASWSTIPFCHGSSGLAVYKAIRCQWKVSLGWDQGGGSSFTSSVVTSWENQGCCSWQPDLVIACGLCLTGLCWGANYWQ